jgi:hypothetical protein
LPVKKGQKTKARALRCLFLLLLLLLCPVLSCARPVPDQRRGEGGKNRQERHLTTNDLRKN